MRRIVEYHLHRSEREYLYYLIICSRGSIYKTNRIGPKAEPQNRVSDEEAVHPPIYSFIFK